MKRYSILFIFSFVWMLSCSRTNRLTKEDYNWMPYAGNETLVFKSNTGLADTIFLLKKDTLFGHSGQYSVISSKYEVLSVFCKHTDPYTPAGEKYYNENHFVEIIKGADNEAEIVFSLSAENARFYRSDNINLDSLGKEKPTMLQTKQANYHDVYIINGEDILDYGKRSDFITKLYWSKSHGLIRYDKKDSVYWELVKKG